MHSRGLDKHSSSTTVEEALSKRSRWIIHSTDSVINCHREQENKLSWAWKECQQKWKNTCWGPPGGTVTSHVIAQVLPAPNIPREIVDWAGGQPATREPNPSALCQAEYSPQCLEILSAGNIKCITSSSWKTVWSVYSLWLNGSGVGG